MTGAVIAGIDMIHFGRFPDRSLEDLGAEAALMALADAGLTIHDVEALYCGSALQAIAFPGQRVLRRIGQRTMPVLNVVNGCATGASAFREAVLQLGAGGTTWRWRSASKKMDRGLIVMPGRPAEFREEGAIGTITTPCMFSQAGVVHSAAFGTTFEQYAKVSVKNHHHATMNEKAFIRRETPLEEVMASEMIAYPNTKLMCSINVDGAAAAIVTSEAFARQHGLMNRAVRVARGGVARQRLHRHGRRPHRLQCGDARKPPSLPMRWSDWASRISTWWNCMTASLRPNCCTTRIWACAAWARAAR